MAKKIWKKAKGKIHTVMKEYKAGKLHIGKSKKKVQSRKQALAIGISESRKEGVKIPKRRRK